MGPENKELLYRILRENKSAIYIGSLRPETKKLFIEIANKDFLGNYGSFLEHLFNFWKYHKESNIFQKLNDQIIDLENRLEKMENKK